MDQNLKLPPTFFPSLLNFHFSIPLTPSPVISSFPILHISYLSLLCIQLIHVSPSRRFYGNYFSVFPRKRKKTKSRNTQCKIYFGVVDEMLPLGNSHQLMRSTKKKKHRSIYTHLRVIGSIFWQIFFLFPRFFAPDSSSVTPALGRNPSFIAKSIFYCQRADDSGHDFWIDLAASTVGKFGGLYKSSACNQKLERGKSPDFWSADNFIGQLPMKRKKKGVHWMQICTVFKAI